MINQWTHHIMAIGLLTLVILTVLVTSSFAGTIQYSYDDMGRLIQAEYENGTVIEYSYDTMGNRLTKTVSTGDTPPNTPPYLPSAPSVAAGAVDVSLTPVLAWTGGDPDAGDTVVYEVSFGLSGHLAWVATEGQPQYVPGPLEPATTYCWQIVAWDAHNASTEGPVWCFTTTSELPSTPTPTPTPPAPTPTPEPPAPNPTPGDGSPTPTPGPPVPTPTPDDGIPTPVPEPGTVILFGLGLLALLSLGRSLRRR